MFAQFPSAELGARPPVMVTVPMAVTNPEFWDRPIEVCGHVVRSSGPPRESMMYGERTWLSVDVSGRQPLQVSSAACVKGVVRRRDGLSNQEARARRLPFRRPSHGE